MSGPKNDEADTGKRPLIWYHGARERLLYLYSMDHPRHLCVVGELSGWFSMAVFRAALDLVQHCHPHLGVAIADWPDGPALVEHSCPIPVRPILEGDIDWEWYVEEEMNTALPPTHGPLMRITSLRDAGRGDRL
jgi:hypothetical protein